MFQALSTSAKPPSFRSLSFLPDLIHVIGQCFACYLPDFIHVIGQCFACCVSCVTHSDGLNISCILDTGRCHACHKAYKLGLTTSLVVRLIVLLLVLASQEIIHNV